MSQYRAYLHHFTYLSTDKFGNPGAFFPIGFEVKDHLFLSNMAVTYKSLYGNKEKYVAEYKRLFDIQKGLCGVCEADLTKQKTTVIDHCHKSGLTRGLLCSRCNTVVGYAEHDLLLKARRYLDRIWARHSGGDA